jgi:hypothetical protein
VSQRLFGGGADAALPETWVLAATAIVSLGLTLFAPRCFPPQQRGRHAVSAAACGWPLPVSACCGRPKSTLLQAAVPAARFRQCPVLRRLGTGGDGVSVAGGAGLVHSGHQPWRSRRALQALTVQASSSAQRSPRPAPAWRSHISAVSSRVGSLARPGLGTRDISASSAGTSAKSRSIASLP